VRFRFASPPSLLCPSAALSHSILSSYCLPNTLFVRPSNTIPILSFARHTGEKARPLRAASSMEILPSRPPIQGNIRDWVPSTYPRNKYSFQPLQLRHSPLQREDLSASSPTKLTSTVHLSPPLHPLQDAFSHRRRSQGYRDHRRRYSRSIDGVSIPYLSLFRDQKKERRTKMELKLTSPPPCPLTQLLPLSPPLFLPLPPHHHHPRIDLYRLRRFR